MDQSVEVKINLTRKQLELLCSFIGEQEIKHTKAMIELLELDLDNVEVDVALASLYWQLSKALY